MSIYLTQSLADAGTTGSSAVAYSFGSYKSSCDPVVDPEQFTVIVHYAVVK